MLPEFVMIVVACGFPLSPARVDMRGGAHERRHYGRVQG